jgi:hypothetical protein
LTTLGPAEPVSARAWPAERVEFWSIERLIPYGDNARFHSETDLEKIAAAILKWGWTNPVLVDEHGVLIAGHLRAAAAARLGLKSIPVMVARGWSEDEKQAYRLADNEQLVYDPFLGSGTSVIAAEMAGRTCIGLEISPAYVDVIVKRWQAFTGRTAIHQASGQSFDERADRRDRAQSGVAHA